MTERWSLIPKRLDGSLDSGAAHVGWLRQVVTAAGCLLVYLALEWLSDLHETQSVPITPWNPGLGFMFGIMVLCDVRFALVLAGGYALADQMFIGERLPLGLLALISAIVGGGYGLAALVARRWVPADHGLTRLADVMALLLAGIGGALLVSGAVALALVTAGNHRVAELPATIVPLLVGDTIGIAIFAPIVLQLARRIRLARTMIAATPPLELVVIGLAIVALLSLMHLRLGQEAMRYIFVLFAPVVLAAIRHGLDGACFSLAVAQFGIILVLNTTGQDVRSFTEVQAEMLALTITGLIVGVVVSERMALSAAAREAELRLKALQIEADQAGRISLAGGMSSVIAHEINQPITAARALARAAQHLIAGQNADLARAARNLDASISQIDLAASIIARMREFVRRGRPHVSTIDVHELLATAVSLFKADGRFPAMEVRIDVAPTLPSMFGDRTQLGQVLLNLMRNSAEAIHAARVAGGLIEVGADIGAEAGTIEFFVRDNGGGVPRDRQDMLFEPVRSDKRDGLGLGLAISAFVVQNHRGRLWLAESRPGRTEFRMAVPFD